METKLDTEHVTIRFKTNQQEGLSHDKLKTSFVHLCCLKVEDVLALSVCYIPDKFEFAGNYRTQEFFWKEMYSDIS